MNKTDLIKRIWDNYNDIADSCGMITRDQALEKSIKLLEDYISKAKQDNLTLIKEEFNRDKGQFVMCDDKLVRLIGIAQDSEDYYWVFYDGRKITLHSCVGGYIRLKHRIDTKDYNDLIRIAKLNHSDLRLKGDIFYETYIDTLLQYFNKDTTLIEPAHFDLN